MAAAELGRQTVEFSSLVRRATEDSFLSLKELVENSKALEQQSDSDKKIDLLKYIIKTRQRMLRLHVLAKWCQQVPLVQYCQQLASTLSSHDTCFIQTADSLFYVHDGLLQARAPMFDVPSATEVLLTGNYQRLPKRIEDLGMQSVLAEDKLKPTLKKLDAILRSKLLEVSLPKEISEISVSDGTAIIRVDGEFKVILTLGYRGHLSHWRILHLELLVGEKSGLVKLEETRRYALGDELERRMAASENPLMILYTILHEFSVALVMDTIIRQVQALRQGRWKEAIRFELISDGNVGQGANANVLQLIQDAELDSSALKTPGLKIFYWLDSEKSTGGSDSSSTPYIKIEPGQDLQIRCLHSPFVIDPLTDREAEFSLDQSCIDVEKVLLRAISCNKHTRLLEVHRELIKNVQICQASGDVILRNEGSEGVKGLRKKDGKPYDEDDCGHEVLCMRAYGPLYITLGINIRNGRFLLQSSQNILEPSTLRECEEVLNQGSMTAAEVFASLRGKSILRLFASTGKFLGLKVYEQCSSTMKLPNSILHGPDLLLMGFPQCGSFYHLLMQLDKDFKPLFKLLETLPDPDGHPHQISDVNNVMRYKKIDIGQIRILEDEMNLSLLDWDKQLSVPALGSSNQTSDHVLSELGLEPVLQLAGCSQSSFASLVDEVFEFEKASSGPAIPVQNHISSLGAASLSQFNSIPPSNQTIKAEATVNNTKVSFGSFCLTSSLHSSSNIKGLLNNGPSHSMPSSSPARSTPMQRLSTSKSDQDLNSPKSHSRELVPYSAIDEECIKDMSGGTTSRQTRVLSPLRTTASRNSALPTLPGPKAATGPKNSSTNNVGSNLWITTPVWQELQSGSCTSKNENERTSRKRSISDVLMMIPSIQGLELTADMRKIRKIMDATGSHPADSQIFSPVLNSKRDRYMHGTLLSEANHGIVPSNRYFPALLHVIRHCSLCIKHARLTSQMDALDIPYVEEVGLRTPSSNLWFRLPFAVDGSWQNICLRLGKPGSMCWDVKINDKHFKELWELQKGSNSTPWGSGVRIANSSDVDSHIRYDPEGVVLSYKTVEVNSIDKLVTDLRRLSNARLFACGMRNLLGASSDDKHDNANSDNKLQSAVKGEVVSEQVKKTFKIEAVGLMSLWFTYGTMPVTAHFVVEWEAGKEGCTIHVSPDQLWPHTKFLEDFINGGEVASFLDCIRLTAGPLLALNHAIRPARMPAPVTAAHTPVLKQTSQGLLPNAPSSVVNQPAASVATGTAVLSTLGNQNLHNATVLSAAGRGGPGIVPSSLLPIDVSVVLRGPYWIRIIYRKKFAVDMRCFAGDQVWLQPATPPKGGPAAGGSLPCPQFRPFIMEHVAQGLNALEPNFPAAAGGHLSTGNTNPTSGAQPVVQNGNRINVATSGSLARPTAGPCSQVANSLTRVSNAMLASSGITAGLSGVPLRISPGTGLPVHVRGELNTAFIGLGDDGGYGGGWVPLAALKKVLRGILKYLGVLWLFAQLPDLLKEILGSILKENEGALLNLDQEQPALRFFVGGYVFAVSVHRVQLLLQVLSVKRFQHQQQQQQQQTQSNTQEELTQPEITEICEYFSRRVASEPYDASRVASFITLLTLPISVLREFLKLIAWEKGLSQAHGGEIAPAQRARIELCLENHSLSASDETSSLTRSNIHHDRAHNSVSFALTFVLDPAHIPNINAAGGAAWLPYCVSVRLKYSFGESIHLSLLGMEGSHGGRACWFRSEDWEKCRQRVSRAVEYANGNSVGDLSQGRLRSVAETLQRTLQVSLQQLRDGALSSGSAAS